MNNSTITIRDIAAKAGVSIATVSRVINQSNRVTDSTKKKVQQVIDELNYKPNAIARSLYTKRSNVIGCILPDITNHYFSQIYLAIERAAYQSGYTMFMCNSMNQSGLESVYLDKLVEQQVDSVIFMGGRVNDCYPKQETLEELKAVAEICPMVVINGEMYDNHIYMINTDEAVAVDQMVDYLVKAGYRRLAMVGGARDITVTEFKMSTFKKSCLKRGLTESDFFVRYGEFNFESGVKLLTEMYQQKMLPEAVIAINDEVAAGMLHACIQWQIDVPGQLAIMGYDNTNLAEYTYPRLTTYSHPYVELAKSAMETIGRLHAGDSVANHQLFRGTIIERESVKK